MAQTSNFLLKIGFLVVSVLAVLALTLFLNTKIVMYSTVCNQTSQVTKPYFHGRVRVPVFGEDESRTRQEINEQACWEKKLPMLQLPEVLATKCSICAPLIRAFMDKKGIQIQSEEILALLDGLSSISKDDLVNCMYKGLNNCSIEVPYYTRFFSEDYLTDLVGEKTALCFTN